MDEIELFPSGLMAAIWDWMKPDGDYAGSIMILVAIIDIVAMLVITLCFMLMSDGFAVIIYFPIIIWKMFVWTQINDSIPFALGLPL